MSQIGDKATFIEHAVHVTDLDSLMEQAVTVWLREDTEDVELKAPKLAEKRAGRDLENALALSGNTLEYEYIDKTGRTATGIRTKRGDREIWVIGEDLTPRTLDLNEYFKH